MLKKLTLLTAILLLGALSAAAQSPCQGGDDLSWLREPEPQPAATGGSFGDFLASLFPATPEPAVTADPVAQGTIELASAGRKPNGMAKTVTCSEDCNELPDISCMGQACSAVSRNCSSESCERGSVTCDGVTTYCSQVCPPNCTFFECRQPCKQPGCFASCVDTCTCECETICP